MPDQSVNNRRIVRNTLFLYFRMFLVMGITLFTSRIVLSTLGIEDFGIYNVVGGIVAMSGIMNGAMSVSAQRYLTFEIGRGDHVRLKQVFNMCVLIFALFSFITLILAETAGLWFLNNKMVIPPGRLPAANRIFQFSVFASIASLMVIPYNALIIARERMNVYAYIGILEVLLKLGVVYLLLIIPVDRLSVYGCLMFLSQVVVTGAYVSYCRKRFPESRYRFYWERPLFKELVSYSGWNLFGSAASLVKGQGLNVLLNLFFNPSVNAARGIAYQVNSAITQFFTNFYTAVRPQITKYYAQGNQEEMNRLVFRSSRFSFYLIMLVSMPVIIETPYLINLWLGQLPEYVVPFTRLVVVISAVDATSAPLMTAAHATGRIRLYQSLVGTMTLLNIPVSYAFLQFGTSPLAVFHVSLVISVLCLFMRLWIVHRLMAFPVRSYIIQVLGTSISVCVVSSIVPLAAYLWMEENIFSVLGVCLLCLVSSAVTIYSIGMNGGERHFIVGIVKKKILRKQAEYD